MATSILTQTVFNAPYGIDETNTRMWLRGKLSFATGDYIAGGLLPNLGVTTASILDALKDTAGAVVTIPTYTQPSVGIITAVTSVSTGATTTIYTATTPTVGQYVTLNGLTTAAALNGKTFLVATVSAGASFTCVTTLATQGKTADTGTVATVIGPDDMEIHSVAPTGYIYQYNKTTARIMAFQVPSAAALTNAAPLLELGATATPGGVTGDTVHYVASWAKQ